MTLVIGFVMDSLDEITWYKDTTFALMLAAQARGHQIIYLESGDLWLEEGVVMARQRTVSLRDQASDWYAVTGERPAPAHEIDIILMRKDPPVDAAYIYLTWLLDLIARRGTLVINRPSSLRDCNEKLFATHFPQWCPPSCVSHDASHLRAFQQQHGEVVCKPLDGMGGEGIFRIGQGGENRNVIFETLTRRGRRPAMIQKYLPQITQGDKRILVLFGEPVSHVLARIPGSDDHRGNLAAGGRGEARPLSARDREIASALGPELMQRGLWFVGLDVIGDYLTEINVTSPTCLREIDAQCGLNLADGFFAGVEQRFERKQ